MGACCSKQKPKHDFIKSSKEALPQKEGIPVVWHFKAQVGTKKLIVFDTLHSTFWELELESPYEFQQNQLVCRVSADFLLVVGGKDDGKNAMMIDLRTKTGRAIASPPIPVEHGTLHHFEDCCYAVGCTTQVDDVEHPAPCLCFNLKSHTWSYLPSMPTQVMYPGSFVNNSGLHVLGGFIKSGEDMISSKSIQTFYFSTKQWAVSHLSAPLSTGFPMCALLDEEKVLVVGGHDPSETYQETRDVYCFNWKDFSPVTSLPEVGALCFKEPPLVTHKAIYAISEDEVLFKFDVETKSWTSLDIEAKLHDDPARIVPAPPRRMPGDYVYFYDPESMFIVEYDIVSNTSRKTEPSSFQSFFKDSGMAILSNGCLIFAGGKLHGEVTKKVWTFDPVNRIARNLPDLPQPQFGLRLVVKGDRVYALAGCDERTLVDDTAVNYCQVLTSDGWEELPAPAYQTKYPAAASIGQNIYCIGGKTKLEFEVSLNLIQKYNIPKKSWKLLRVEYPLGVYYLGLNSLPNNQLLCFGGLYSSGHPVSESFTFDGKSFRVINHLVHGLIQEPEDTKFLDCPVLRGDTVYAFSAKGVLHRYSCNEW
eukprot:CAMPEP_0204897120 /NCGR_PEP_ID=MMETSP1397-20131031/557_1 /ASSEMBLY_ACC=CAM_ASM_000891 /TAXON_ID=49980 /ORGANISM="Climacostomum Climacostomum virens, Strain Stock W-24" /LENGTH=589 /DNA_ID=CAMNT_0052064829 /DNA_START=1830 /DNA_END=3596 /DNA_ORIENTATION=-